MRAKTKGMMGEGERKEGIAFFITVFAIAWNVFYKRTIQSNFTNLVIQEYSVSYTSILTSCQFTNEPNHEISRGVFQNRGVCGQAFPLLPSPFNLFFFCCRSNVCAITLLETLATQARYPWTSAILQKPSRGLVVSRPLTVNQVNSRRFIDWFSCCVQRYGVVVL